MLNLLGDVWFDDKGTMRLPDWAAVLALPGTHLHLYGKTEARKARKMGHLNVTGVAVEQVREVALKAAAILGIEAF
jgi:5-(carboxyamino)imidazole ribonucleotide synthase